MFFQGEVLSRPPSLSVDFWPDGPTVKYFILSWQTWSWLPLPPQNSPSENTGGVKIPEVVGLPPPPPSEQPHWQPVVFHRRLAGLASRNAFDFGEIVILFALILVNAFPPSLGPPWKAREPPSPASQAPGWAPGLAAEPQMLRTLTSLDREHLLQWRPCVLAQPFGQQWVENSAHAADRGPADAARADTLWGGYLPPGEIQVGHGLQPSPAGWEGG